MADRKAWEGHTPAPWVNGIHHAQEQGGRTYAYVFAGGVVPVACVLVAVEGYGRPEGAANAALIAAAPHLAARVEKLEAALLEIAEDTFDTSDGHVRVIHNIARAALEQSND